MVIYQHKRLDTNEIFYVGIGKSEKRAYSKRSRNSLWHNIANKTDYTVEIVTTCDTWEEACQIEQYLIKFYGRRDLGLGNLVNMTDGGDGSLNMTSPRKGVTLSEETKRKISEAKKGKPSPNKGKKISEEQKAKISEINKGNSYRKGKTHSKEAKAKISEVLKGRLAPNRKKVICTITGFIWDSIKECANDNNIKYSTLNGKLNGSNKNNTNFIIYE